jgi:nucleotide-binding universal stress UspA family protein
MQNINLFFIFGMKIMYSRILLPTDGSEGAEKSARHALWIASKSGADILVMNVFEIFTPTIAFPISTIAGSNEELYEPLKEEAEKIAEDLIDKIRASEEFKSADINIEMVVREGNPYNEILKIIEKKNIDLVVMGASGRHGFDRIALGSETERVVRASKVPVLVVP